MSSRTLVVGALAWVLVVTLGSGLVWAVISRAGEGVSSSAEPLDPTTSGRTRATGDPSGGPTGTHQTQGTKGSQGGGSQGSHDGSGGEPHPSGGAATGSSSPGGSLPPTSIRRTWSGAAGLVTAECTGSKISLVSAQPSNGYAMEPDANGPVQVEVEFENTATGRKTKVEAVCSSGTPVFESATEADD